MATTYNGVAGNASLASGVSVIVPADADPLNVASVNPGLQKHADYLEAIRSWLQGTAGLAVVILTNVVNAIGLQSTGNGTGAGLKGIGGSTGAPGVSAAAGSGNTRGALNLTPQAAPSAPADGDAWVETTTNVLKVRINGVTYQLVPSTSKGIARAWATLTCGAAGAVTVTEGFNVSSGSYSSNTLSFTLTAANPDTTPVIVAQQQVAATPYLVHGGFPGSTTVMGVAGFTTAGAGRNFVSGDVVRVLVYD